MKVPKLYLYSSVGCPPRWSLFAFAALVFIPGLGCSQNKTVNWKEEVRLRNKQVVIIERNQEYRAGGEPGHRGAGWIFDNERIKAALPSPNGDVRWQAHLHPLSIDVSDDGKVYLVTVVADARGRQEYGLPGQTNHIAFRYIGNDQWERVPLGAVPAEFRPNFLIDWFGLFIEKGSKVDFVDLALKEKLDSDHRIDSRFRGWPRQ